MLDILASTTTTTTAVRAATSSAPTWVSYGGLGLGALGAVTGSISCFVNWRSYRASKYKVTVSATLGFLKLSGRSAVLPITVENSGQTPVTITRFALNMPSGRYYALAQDVTSSNKTPARLEANDTKEFLVDFYNVLNVLHTMATMDEPAHSMDDTISLVAETGIEAFVQAERWSMSLRDAWNKANQ